MQLNIFFALLPDPVTAARVTRRTRRTCDRYGFSGRPIPAKRLHVSLHSVGGFVDVVPPRLIADAAQAADSVREPQFEVTFDRALSLTPAKTSRFPFVLKSADEPTALLSFRHALGAALERTLSGFNMKRSITPHLTLIRDEKIIADHPIPPVRWTVREFVLVMSFVGRSHYDILGRWPLLGD